MSRNRIKLVIPAFREADRITEYVGDLAGLISSQSLPVTILIVDDGSGESEFNKTKAALAPVLKNHPDLVKLMALPQNRGKGGAIRAGWNDPSDQPEYLAFADADGAVSARETIRFLDHAINSREPVSYFASRIKMLGQTVNRSLVRHLTGRVFATIVSITTDIPVYDSQCGCKAIPRRDYETVRSVLEENRFAFDVELITALFRSGHQMVEIPVNWSDIAGTKVSLFSDPFRMFLSCLKIRKRARYWKFVMPAESNSPDSASLDAAHVD